MKRLVLLLLLVPCLLLGGCGHNDAAGRFAPFSEELAARSDLCFTAALRAEYPDRSAAFTLRYEDCGPGAVVTVLEPEEIRGVSVHVNGAESSLGYDAIVLDTGALDRYGLSPASAPVRLVQALREGHLESAWEEEGLTVWEIILDDGQSVCVWLSEALVPVRAELISDGRVTVFCEIGDWS